jgi:DNA-binding GntR family transcriptional regulator
MVEDRLKASDRAYLTLRGEILDAELGAGAVLAEVEQSQRLGVSRTPLREALSRLAAEGLVSTHSGRGVVVTEVSAENVTELFEVREALEVQAARLAARRGDASAFAALREEFHDVDAVLADRHRYYDLVARLDSAIDTAAANPYLVSTLEGVRTHVARIRRLAQDDRARLRDAAREHVQILDAIIDGDESLAASATQVHLRNSLRNILRTTTAAR